VQVQLVTFQVVDQRVFLVDQLVQPFDLLRQHDDLVLEVFHLHFDVLVLVERLFQVHDFRLVGLDLVVTIP
jgi:hypothetical protein